MGRTERDCLQKWEQESPTTMIRKTLSDPLLLENVETRPATAITRSSRVVDNLELTSNQLHRVIHRTSVKQLQRRFIHDDFGLAGSGRSVLRFEDGIFFGVDLRRCFEGHHILKPMTAAACHGDPEVVVGVFLLRG